MTKTKPKPDTDSDIVFDAADQRFDQIVEGAELELKTLRGDLRDAVLQIIRQQPKHWGALSKMEQHDVAAVVDMACEKLVRRASDVLAAHGRPMIPATIDNFKVKDGLIVHAKAVFTKENLELLGEAQNRGKNIVLTIADAGVALGQRKAAKLDEDQPSLLGDHASDLAADREADPELDAAMNEADDEELPDPDTVESDIDWDNASPNAE